MALPEPTTILTWLDAGRDIATIAGTIIALSVYVSNSAAKRRQRLVENTTRIIDLHRRICEAEYIKHFWPQMERGMYRRDLEDAWAEDLFVRLLGEFEYVAHLWRVKAISDRLNTYMFGWFAMHIAPALSPREESEKYWDLVVAYLKGTAKAAEKFYGLKDLDREKFHKAAHG